jgi:hypothetical protein
VNRGFRETLDVISEDDEPSIRVPESALVGLPFKVQFATQTDGCTRPAATKLMLSASRAVIEPRIYIAEPPPENCNDIGGYRQHAVQLRFDQVGPATVVIRGVRRGSLLNSLDTVTFERTVMMRQ